MGCQVGSERGVSIHRLCFPCVGVDIAEMTMRRSPHRHKSILLAAVLAVQLSTVMCMLECICLACMTWQSVTTPVHFSSAAAVTQSVTQLIAT